MRRLMMWPSATRPLGRSHWLDGSTDGSVLPMRSSERRYQSELKYIHSSTTLFIMNRTYSSPLRAEQAQATRRRILDAARAQFLDGGGTRPTVQVIADAAAVSPATVYAVFGSKRAVLSVLIDEALASALPDPAHPDAWPEAA